MFAGHLEGGRGPLSPYVSCPVITPASRTVLLLLSLGWAAVSIAGEDTQPTEKLLAHCAAMGPAADRLLCYDKLVGRAPSTPVSLTVEPAPVASPPVTSLLAPKDAPVAPAVQDSRLSGSLLSRYWELDPLDKRGTFNLTGYKPNYVLPLHTASRINRAPASPTQAAVNLPAYRKIESQFQLSFRTKALQGVGFENSDLWLGFTQQTFWQVWNPVDSKPFRNTDYEPELIYVIPTPASWRVLLGGWQWRFTQLALAHQSNGQADPLSRSWNRAYLGAGAERGDWTLTARVNNRMREKLVDDNNPDLLDYRGRGEVQLGWSPGVSTFSLLYRSTLKNFKSGAVKLEWTHPVFSEQPNGVRYLVQLYHGYGETLTDYNFRQSSLGMGLSFMQF